MLPLSYFPTADTVLGRSRCSQLQIITICSISCHGFSRSWHPWFQLKFVFFFFKSKRTHVTHKIKFSTFTSELLSFNFWKVAHFLEAWKLPLGRILSYLPLNPIVFSQDNCKSLKIGLPINSSICYPHCNQSEECRTAAENYTKALFYLVFL